MFVVFLEGAYHGIAVLEADVFFLAKPSYDLSDPGIIFEVHGGEKVVRNLIVQTA